jgi:malto-oligosyltrehalose trehalohydrolase
VTDFRVWAPVARHVTAEIDGRPVDMTAARDGWWDVSVPEARPDARYGFRLDGGDLLPDPRSRRQPDGPAGLSQLYGHAGSRYGAFAWTDSGWRGRPVPGSVLYELHIGTFTPAGTFDAAIERLDHLVALGIDVVELMPVASFPGLRGWGYDGISLWAVHEPYGGPDGLKRFVDACHARGLAVLLDVVYNHVGIGNRLAAFGPYFTNTHVTPWGPAVNLDQPGSAEVRAFIIENALMWLRDYHLDGLRLDAVHALADSSDVHVLEQLAVAVADLAKHRGRELVLIAESDANDPRFAAPREEGGYGLTGQWNDDFHHALHAALTGERQGYYSDFGSLAVLAKTLTHVFRHDGGWSTFRGAPHGHPVDVHSTPGYRFVGYLQNHDQIGNRAAGDRLSASLTDGLLRVGAGLALTAPFTPMLFMGEEWGASTPWQFFADHPDPGFGRAVAEGRRAEFARHGWTGEVPDPQAEGTFARSKLNWAELDTEPHRSLLAWYRELIALRRTLPELRDPRLDHVSVSSNEEQRWLVVNRGGVPDRDIRVAANLSPRGQRLTTGIAGGRLAAASAPGIRIEDSTVWLPPTSLAVIVG